MTNEIASVMTCIVFFLIGVACLFFPDKIQLAALKYYDQHPTAGRLNPFLEWMKSPGYVLSLRIIGLTVMAGFILIIIAFVRVK